MTRTSRKWKKSERKKRNPEGWGERGIQQAGKKTRAVKYGTSAGASVWKKKPGGKRIK